MQFADEKESTINDFDDESFVTDFGFKFKKKEAHETLIGKRNSDSKSSVQAYRHSALQRRSTTIKFSKMKTRSSMSGKKDDHNPKLLRR